MRVARFLRGGGDSVETDEGEEHDGGSAHDPAETVGHKGMPVGGVNHERAKGNEEDHDGHFDENDDGVGLGAFADAVNEQGSDGGHDEQRRDIKGDMMTSHHGQRGGGISLQALAAFFDNPLRGGVIVHQPERESEIEEAAAQLHEVTGPADGHGHVPDGIFQDQVPADDPGDDLPEGGIGVSVSRPGDGNHGSQFAVTKSRKSAGHRGHDEGKNHGRPGAGSPHDHIRMSEERLNVIQNRRLPEGSHRLALFAGRRRPGQRKNPGSDNGADAEAGEIESGE